MNFSLNRKFKRFLSVTLVLMMMAALFAGCKQNVPAPETEPNLNLNLSDQPTSSETESTTQETEAPVINENTGTVTSVLNIRSSPSTEATVIGTLYAGDKVEVSRREVVTGIDWAYIIAPESGWIVMEFVEMDIPSETPVQPDTSTPAGDDASEDKSEETANTTNIKAVVTANGLNIRSEASTSGKVQGAYNKGDVITILETKNGWGRTNKGWIKMEYVKTNSTTVGSNNTDNNKDTNQDSTAEQNPDITSNGNTTVIWKGVVKVTDLNLRSEGSTNGERLGNLTYGARVEVLEKSGNWGRTKDGWVCLDYVYEDGTTGAKTAEGLVTGDQLNIRSGPGTGYASVGSYNEGDRVTILEQFTYNGTTWGCTNQGWVSMKYVDVGNSGNGTDNNGNSTDIDGNLSGTVIGNGLNIRSGAGSDYPAVGTLNYGDRVTILEEKKVGDTTWGKIADGWVSLDFVALD